MLQKTNTTALLRTQMVKYYLNPLPSLIIVMVLKLYFRKSNPYHMI